MSINFQPTSGWLPVEIIQKVYLHLNDFSTLYAVSLVCKEWRSALAKPDFLKKLYPLCLKKPEKTARAVNSLMQFFFRNVPIVVFTQSHWKKYLGQITNCPPLPKHIYELLESPCPFWKGKRVQDTHVLVLIPGMLNKKSLTLNRIEKAIEDTQAIEKIKKLRWGRKIKKKYGNNKVKSAYWALITKEIIPKSRVKELDEQAQMIKAIHPKYKIPRPHELLLAYAFYLFHNGKELFTSSEDYNPEWTRCKIASKEKGYLLFGSYRDGANLELIRPLEYCDDTWDNATINGDPSAGTAAVYRLPQKLILTHE